MLSGKGGLHLECWVESVPPVCMKPLLDQLSPLQLYPTDLIENEHVTFADIGDSFLHQVNDATRGSNNDMHCGKERWRGGRGVNKMAQLCYCVVARKPLYNSGTFSIAETSLYRTKGCGLD